MLAIIAARGGSKRIPRKNIKEFMGKPMIAYAIDAAFQAEIFEEVMVSTDDPEIAEISKKYGADVPFMRSAENSNDFAVTKDVVNEVISEYKKRGKEFDNICCIYPCVPFLTGKILKEAYETFKRSKCDRLIPVVKFSFPIQRALILDKSKCIKYREPENEFARSQDMEPTYHDAGMFNFYKAGKIESNLIAAFEMDEINVQDIDNEQDWKLAELKYKVMHNV